VVAVTGSHNPDVGN